jgi:hypothetical protein
LIEGSKDMARREVFGMRLDALEKDGLGKLAAIEGLDTIAPIVRRLIRRELASHGLYDPQARPVRRGRPAKRAA